MSHQQNDSSFQRLISSDHYVVFGIDDLSTQTCETPCQMRRVVRVDNPGINITIADIAIATLDFEVNITEYVSEETVKVKS